MCDNPTRLSRPLFVDREQPAVGLLKPRFLSLGLDLPQHCRVDRGVRCLAACAPQLLAEHRIDTGIGLSESVAACPARLQIAESKDPPKH